jgi:glycosyltransferase involved in cell wall biosynthesis
VAPTPPGAAPDSPLRAVFIANGDPRDLKTWSGTPRHMLEALEKRVDMRLVVRSLWPRWYRPLGRALKLLSGRRFEYSWSGWYSGLAGRRTIRQLRAARPDVVFAVALTDMAYLFAEELPVVYITDAVIPDLLEYYEMFQRISDTAKRRALQAERDAFEAALLLHFPSAWAVRSAIEKQKVSPHRVVEIAWGANMPFQARPERALSAGPLQLLFVGTHWDRKGGPIALDAAAELARRGIDSRLDIVGCTAEVATGPVPANVTFHGFVNKGTEAGRILLDRLYADANFFILPTLAEAYGIVFAEAAHHGLPSLAYATGGVTSVVRDGETGILLPLGSSGADIADQVEALAQSPERYARMSGAALADARDRLNWDIWADRLEAAVRERLQQAGEHKRAPRAVPPLEVKGVSQ